VFAQKAFKDFLRGGELASETVVEALAFGQLLLKRFPRLLGNAGKLDLVHMGRSHGYDLISISSASADTSMIAW
jgi:hypothetical protein